MVIYLTFHKARTQETIIIFSGDLTFHKDRIQIQRHNKIILIMALMKNVI